jgi:menaquinone-dependent protoporphyrinogen oxidase
MAASPRVLVSYATAAGSTAGIAERIAGVLRTASRDAVCRPADPDPDLADFDALVLGSAVHDMAWLPRPSRCCTGPSHPGAARSGVSASVA